jgi:hypothetical protein
MRRDNATIDHAKGALQFSPELLPMPGKAPILRPKFHGIADRRECCQKAFA